MWQPAVAYVHACSLCCCLCLRRVDLLLRAQDVVSSLSIERFRVFSHLFDAIIEKDVSFSNLLQQVKTEYEASMRNGVNPSFL